MNLQDPSPLHDRSEWPPGETSPQAGSGTDSSAEGAGAGRGRSGRGRLWAYTIGSGVMAGVVAWLAGEATLSVFQPRLVMMDTAVGPRLGATLEEYHKVDSRNAALAFGLLGVCLGLALGLAGGLARGSTRSGAMAGIVGAGLGAILGAGAALALQPLYYWGIARDPTQQSLTLPLLVHAGIWAAVGAAGGIAFGLGQDGRGERIARSALGGLIGAALSAVAYVVIGALVFPEGETTRPISATWGTRLMARLLLATLTAAGIAAIVTSEPRASARPISPSA